MTRWGMAIDLKSCVSCYACTLACKQEHFLQPGIFWNRLLVGEVGKYPSVRKVAYPVLCNHCEDAPCVKACPTGASTIREDGIVEIDEEICTGCQYCLMACPYQQRSLNESEETGYFPGQGITPLEAMGTVLYSHQSGVVEKCTFCSERIDEGLGRKLVPGRDRDATPACVNVCMTKSRIFGDLDDPESPVSRIVRERNGRPLHPEWGTKPSVYYLD